MNQIEIGTLILAGVLILVGASLVIHPTELIVPHQGYRYRSFTGTAVEHFSKPKVRIYGGLGMVFGTGLIWVVFYRRAE